MPRIPSWATRFFSASAIADTSSNSFFTSTVGTLMGALIGGSIFIEGLFARFMYIALYRMHLYALHGIAKVLLDTLARMITRRTEPRIKLH